MTATLQAHGNAIGMSTLSAALGVPRSSAYRWLRPPAPPRLSRATVAVAQWRSGAVAQWQEVLFVW